MTVSDRPSSFAFSADTLGTVVRDSEGHLYNHVGYDPNPRAILRRLRDGEIKTVNLYSLNAEGITEAKDINQELVDIILSLHHKPQDVPAIHSEPHGLDCGALRKAFDAGWIAYNKLLGSGDGSVADENDVNDLWLQYLGTLIDV